MGVSLIAAAGPAVVNLLLRRRSCPPFLPTALMLPGANSMSGNAKTQPLSGLEFTPADLPLTNSSTDSVLAMT